MLCSIIYQNPIRKVEDYTNNNNELILNDVSSLFSLLHKHIKHTNIFVFALAHIEEDEEEQEEKKTKLDLFYITMKNSCTHKHKEYE